MYSIFLVLALAGPIGKAKKTGSSTVTYYVCGEKQLQMAGVGLAITAHRKLKLGDATIYQQI